MVEVKIAGIAARINEYVWTSDNKDLEKLLNSMLDPEGPSGGDPNPDYTAAMQAVEALGGKITKGKALLDDYDPKRVY